jgi:hypothetical protein
MRVSIAPSPTPRGHQRRARTAVAACLTLMAGTAPLSAQIIGLSVLDSASAYVAPGARLAVPLHVDLSAAGTTTLAALQGALSWNASRLTFDSLRVVSTTGFSLTANTASAASGSVSFNAFGTTALAASGPLAMAYFTAGSGTGGTLLTLVPTVAGSEAGGDILALLRVRNLGVCVAPTGAWGDANDDGAVNVIDAQQIARFSVGLSVANSTALAARGDVTADGAVNVIDAQQIARFSVALSAAARVNTALYTPLAAASVVFTPSGAQSLLAGATVALTAEPRDAGSASLAGCRPVTWSSSNPAVATVSSVGLVTAVSAGAATITASVDGISATAAITVANVPVASVIVSPDSATLVVGVTRQLTAGTRDAAGNGLSGHTVLWSSSAPSVAIVSSIGVVTAVASGTATITATTAAEGISGTATLTVRDFVADTLRGVYTAEQGALPVQLRLTGGGSAPTDIQYELLTDSLPRPDMSVRLNNPSPLSMVDGVAPLTASAWGTGVVRVRFTIQDGGQTVTRTSPQVRVRSATHCLQLQGVPDTALAGAVIAATGQTNIRVLSCRGDESLYRYRVVASLVDSAGVGTPTLTGTLTSAEGVEQPFSDLRINTTQTTAVRLKFTLVGCPDLTWCHPTQTDAFVLSPLIVVKRLEGTLLVVSGTDFSSNTSRLLQVGGTVSSPAVTVDTPLFTGGYWGSLAPDRSFVLQGNLPNSDKMQRRNAPGWLPTNIFGTGARDYGARLSPDGSRVVWFRESSLTSSAREIWIGNPDGTGATQLTSDAEPDNTPDIATDNQHIVWSAVRSSARNIWIMRANGSEKRQISTGGTDDLPRFSPDGARIAFVSSRDGTPAVYIMDRDGLNVRKLAGTEIFQLGVAGEVAPLWSKDGRLLYFNGRIGSGPIGVFVIPSDGSALPVRLRNNTVSEAIYDLR